MTELAATDTFPLGKELTKVRTLPGLRELLETVEGGEIKVPPWVKTMTALSLCMQRRAMESKHKFGPSGEEINLLCEIDKEALEEMARLREQKASHEEIFRKLETIVYYHALIVVAPQILLEMFPKEQQNEFLFSFFSINVQHRNPGGSPEKIQLYTLFNEQVRNDCRAEIQGITGEFFAYCLLEKAGLGPVFSSVKEDALKWTDITIDGNKKKQPVQVKTSEFDLSQDILEVEEFSPCRGISIRDLRNRNKGFLIIITVGLVKKDKQLLDALMSTSPAKTDPAIKEIKDYFTQNE